MKSAQDELIWEGRVQLGDEPGVFGDAGYGGLVHRIPITVFRIGASTVKKQSVIVRTEHLETFGGYLGHLIAVVQMDEDATLPNHWHEKIIVTDRFLGSDNNMKALNFDLDATLPVVYLALDLEVDQTVPPGLYNDFIIRQVSFLSPSLSHYAVLGFRSSSG